MESPDCLAGQKETCPGCGEVSVIPASKPDPTVEARNERAFDKDTQSDASASASATPKTGQTASQTPWHHFVSKYLPVVLLLLLMGIVWMAYIRPAVKDDAVALLILIGMELFAIIWGIGGPMLGDRLSSGRRRRKMSRFLPDTEGNLRGGLRAFEPKHDPRLPKLVAALAQCVKVTAEHTASIGGATSSAMDLAEQFRQLHQQDPDSAELHYYSVTSKTMK